MHPDPRHVGFTALVHDLFCGLGLGDDYDAVDAPGNRFEIGITAVSLERLHVRIHREGFVPGALQTAVYEIPNRMVAVVARHACDGYAFLRKKSLYLRFES
jgi:hypothetical protein